jgi:hypothetical protein
MLGFSTRGRSVAEACGETMICGYTASLDLAFGRYEEALHAYGVH